MNWDAIGSIAEFIGAVAVILTLIYLALQTKHNVLAVNQSAQQNLVTEMGAAMGALFENPEVAEIYLKGISSYSSLTPLEKVRFSSLFHQFARVSEQAYLSFRAGTLDAQVWQGLEAQVLDVFSSPGVQEWWVTREDWYSEAFRSLVIKCTTERAIELSMKYSETLQDSAPTNAN